MLPVAATICESCGTALTSEYGWCGGCHMALCLDCGRGHFCHPTCLARGCLAGLCVRLVRDGVLSDGWGLPSDADLEHSRIETQANR